MRLDTFGERLSLFVLNCWRSHLVAVRFTYTDSASCQPVDSDLALPNVTNCLVALDKPHSTA
jgi:hypothetical protein